MQKILIIDDDNELFSLLSDYLQDEGFSCIHAADAVSGLRESTDGTFDIIVLDVMLPGMNGFEVLRRLRANESTSSVPVLMLTARGEEIDRIVGLEMGADDYLGKPFNPRELVARLRAVLRRYGVKPPEAQTPRTQHLEDVSISHATLSVTVNGVQQSLTGAEFRLLQHLVQNTGEIVGRNALYKAIFGHPAYPGDRSLDMLVSRLRKKLGNRPDGGERIKAVRGEGYVYLRSGDQS